MGGFMLMDDNTSKGLLTAEKFLELLEEKKIALPPITEEEILDRSKGDGLSRVITIVQTFWFAIQMSLRMAQDLKLTEIEWFTFALTVNNYFFHLYWWWKPLDVRCPIPITLQMKACTVVQQAELDAGRSKSMLRTCLLTAHQS